MINVAFCNKTVAFCNKKPGYRENETQDPMRTQEPMRTQDSMRTQDPRRTQDLRRTQDPMRTQELMRTQDSRRVQDSRRTQNSIRTKTLWGPRALRRLIILWWPTKDPETYKLAKGFWFPQRFGILELRNRVTKPSYAKLRHTSSY